MADDWENEDFEPPPVPVPRRVGDKWEGEDEDEPVKDSWEDEEAEEKPAEPKIPDTKISKKKKLEQKIAEKEPDSDQRMYFLRVELPDSEQTIELPLEDDGTLLLTTLKSKFANANGLTYDCRFRTEKFANVQIVKLSVTLREGKFLPPPLGWFEFRPPPNTRTYKIRCTKEGNMRRKCVALFSYAPQHEDELALAVGDSVDFIEEVEEGWWRGSHQGKIGVFPSNFVSVPTEVSEAKSSPSSNLGATKALPSTATPTPGNLPISEARNAANVSQIEVLTPVEDASAPSLPPKPVREMARALFPYASQHPDELELNEGDMVVILSKECEDKGWWKGQLNGKIGVFPDNFVELIVVPAAASSPIKPARPERPPEKPIGLIQPTATLSSTSPAVPMALSSVSASKPISVPDKTEALTRKGTAEPDLFQFLYDGGLQSYYGKKGLLISQDQSSYHPLPRMTREPGEIKLGPTKAWSKGAGLNPTAVQTGGGRYSALLNDEGSFVSSPSATNIILGPPKLLYNRPFFRVVPTEPQKAVQATCSFTWSGIQQASRESSLSRQGAAAPTTEQVPFQAKSEIKGKPDRTEDEIQRKSDGIMNEFLSSGYLQNLEIAILRQLNRLICESPKVTTVSSFMQWLFLNNFKKIDAEVKLYVLVHYLYVKAVEEQKNTPKYAEVCKLIFESDTPSASGTGKIRFRKLLLDRCQQTFEKQKKFEEEIISNQKAQLEADTEEKKKKIQMELDKRKGISKHIMLGNISFFGELFKLKMVTVEIVNFHISELLKSPTEEQLECLSKFISIIGKAYEEEYDTKYQRAVADAGISEKQIHIQLTKLDVYLDEMKKLSRREDFSSRIRFMLMQVLDLKKNQWVPHWEGDVFTDVGSANAKKWEVELATLKSNNARLTAALQESTANVEEWKRQLEAFKEENVALKSKLLDTETSKEDELNSGELKKEITTLRLKCDSLETELKTKDKKVKDLSTELKDSLSVMENFKCLYEESQKNEKTTRLVLSQIDAALNSIRSQIHFN